MSPRRVSLFLSLLLFSASPSGQPSPSSTDTVILVTLDGARTEELFGGLDADVLRSTLAKDAKLEAHPAYKRFHAETPEARREKLIPFFWRELMAKHGSIAGNRRLNSAVTLANSHRFSFPGYSEILLGEAHDEAIKSNDRVQNPYVTLLEELRAHCRGVIAYFKLPEWLAIVNDIPYNSTGKINRRELAALIANNA